MMSSSDVLLLSMRGEIVVGFKSSFCVWFCGAFSVPLLIIDELFGIEVEFSVVFSFSIKGTSGVGALSVCSIASWLVQSSTATVASFL